MTLLPLCLLNTSYSDSEGKTQHETQTLEAASSSLSTFYKIQKTTARGLMMEPRPAPNWPMTRIIAPHLEKTDLDN